MHRRLLIALAVLLIPALAGNAAFAATTTTTHEETYSRNEVVAAAQKFFGTGAKGLAEVLQKAFDKYGEPNAYIQGEEGSGAVGVGLRYGKGTLIWKGGGTQPVWWQGPSIGFDVGGNASKCFTLIYRLPNSERLFQRFPGVEGSLYFIGGFSLNYNRLDNIVLAPVRFGVGWRQGANVGYLHFTPKFNPIPL